MKLRTSDLGSRRAVRGPALQPALAQTTTYPTVTDARLEHPDAGG